MVFCICIPVVLALFVRACGMLMTLRTPPAGYRMQPKAVAGRMRKDNKIEKRAQREAQREFFFRIHSSGSVLSALGLCFTGKINREDLFKRKK